MTKVAVVIFVIVQAQYLCLQFFRQSVRRFAPLVAMNQPLFSFLGCLTN
jgi:hypothetical protein